MNICENCNYSTPLENILETDLYCTIHQIQVEANNTCNEYINFNEVQDFLINLELDH